MPPISDRRGVFLAGLLLAVVAIAAPGSAQRVASGAVASIRIAPVCTGGIVVSPASLSFSPVKVGKESGSKIAAVKNDDICKEPYEIFVSITGADPGDYLQTNNCPQILNFPKGCLIDVTFAPKKAGSRVATLEIRARGRTGTDAFAIKLEGAGSE